MRERIFFQQWRSLEIDGEVDIDHLFRFETDVPDRIFEFLVDNNLTKDECLPHLRKAEKSAFDISKKQKEFYLSVEAKEWVHRFYRMDYERLGF